MKTQLSFANLAGIETELLAVLAVDTQTAKGPDAKPQPMLLTADEAVKAAAAAVLASGEFKAGANETVLLHAPAGLAAKRLLIVGLGKQAKATVHSVRNAAGTAVRFAKPRGIRELVLALPDAAELCPPRPAPAPPSRAPLWATSIPTPIAATARTRACSPSPSPRLPDADKAARRSRICRGRHHRREPELRPLAGQRARQQAHAHHSRPARRGHGRRSRPQGARSTPPKSCTS